MERRNYVIMKKKKKKEKIKLKTEIQCCRMIENIECRNEIQKKIEKK